MKFIRVVTLLLSSTRLFVLYPYYIMVTIGAFDAQNAVGENPLPKIFMIATREMRWPIEVESLQLSSPFQSDFEMKTGPLMFAESPP